MIELIEECVIGCKKLDNSFVIAKNRDRTYSPNVSIVHHVDKDREYAVLFDLDTKYVEGYNAKSGIAILNSALENGSDFGKFASNEGKNILRALLHAKSPKEAAKMMCNTGHEVYGNTIIIDKDRAAVLELAKGKSPEIMDITKRDVPTVRTNHSVYTPGSGFTLDGDHMDYISTNTRKAVGEVMFSQGDTIEQILNGLNYRLFGDHSMYDTHRDSTTYKTRSQSAIDPATHTFYFRPVPGRTNFKGVKFTGDKSVKPKISVVVLDYDEPTEVPFQSWSTSAHEVNEIKLSRILDPNDSYEDMSDLNDIESARIKSGKTKDNIDYYVNRENDIITKLVSVQDLIKNKDAAMMHLLGDRDPEVEHDRLSDMIGDFETKTMDLYSIGCKEDSSKEVSEAKKRKPRKKGQHKGSASHSDLYTDEDPKGTITGLGFKDAATARKGVAKVNKVKRSHAHKVQATLVMQQRAKVAKERTKDPEKKKNLNAAYKIWSAHLEKLKAKTKKMNETILRKYVRKMLIEVSSATIPKQQWVLLQTGDPRRESVKNTLYDMVCQTYDSIGGHFKICEPRDLDRYNYWIVNDIDEDPDIDVAIMGKPDIAGNKLGAAANDGTEAASKAYKKKSAELRAGGDIDGVGNWWGEVSGKPAYAMLSRNAIAVEDEAKVAQLLSGDDYIFHGEHPDPNAPPLFKSVKGWYTKRFGNKTSTKIILGNPA